MLTPISELSSTQAVWLADPAPPEPYWKVASLVLGFKFTERLRRKILAGDQDCRRVIDQGDGGEIGYGIIHRPLVEDLVLSMGRTVTKHELIAVGAAFATRAAPVMPPAP